MANDGNRKAPAKVQVLHFPKKSKPRRLTRELMARTEITQIVPELRPSGEKKRRQGRDHEETVSQPTPTSVRKSGEKRKRTKTPPLVMQVDTDPALRYSRRKLEAALKDPSLDKLTPERVADISLFGHRLFEEGKLEEARGVFEGLVALGVDDAFPHTMLGTIYLALGDQSRALALFEAALTLDPEDLAARVYRGEIRLNRGRVKLALEDLRLAMAGGDPEDPFVDRARRLLAFAQRMR